MNKPTLTYIITTFLALGCTQQSPKEFMLAQQEETLPVTQSVNTKIDLLWVIDNSPSMESVQTKVRLGMQQFAQQYMKPSWDIRVAAITTDTYLADPSFWAGPSGQDSYLTSVRSGTANYRQNYFNGSSQNYSGSGGVTVPARSKHYYDSTSWVTSLQMTLFNLFEPSAYAPPTVTYNSSGTEKFQTQGMRIADAKPLLGPNWSKLLIGNHDGPELSMCWDGDDTSPEFIYGATSCFHRDDPADPQYHIGQANCVTPNAANGETGPSQCVNTFANNSVHTGLPIISTVPPQGTPGDQNWVNSLIANFQVNLTPSTMGSASERPFQGVSRFLQDNESDPSLRLFRPGTLRVIIFVGDEDDQSQTPDANQYTYGTGTGYGQGAYAHYISENSSAPFICKKLYTAPNAGYFYPTDDPGKCVDPAWLTPVANVKQELDQFFHQLDGTTSSQNPNYFVAAITTMNTTGLSQLGFTYIAQRYPELVSLVGNGSLTLDLTQSDYTPLLDEVGSSILTGLGQFQLQRAPTSQEDMIVQIIHADGSITTLNNSQYTISGVTLTITDLSVVDAFVSTDQLAVNYQPSTST